GHRAHGGRRRAWVSGRPEEIATKLFEAGTIVDGARRVFAKWPNPFLPVASSGAPGRAVPIPSGRGESPANTPIARAPLLGHPGLGLGAAERCPTNGATRRRL